VPGTQPLPEGDVSVTAVVSDAAGNTATDSTGNEITVDLTPPVITGAILDILPESDTGTNDADNITQDTTLALALPAGTAISGDSVTVGR